MGEDKTKIAVEIEYFNHKHDLKLTDEKVHNNEKKMQRVCKNYSPSFLQLCQV